MSSGLVQAELLQRSVGDTGSLSREWSRLRSFQSTEIMLMMQKEAQINLHENGRKEEERRRPGVHLRYFNFQLSPPVALIRLWGIVIQSYEPSFAHSEQRQPLSSVLSFIMCVRRVRVFLARARGCTHSRCSMFPGM